MLMVADGGDKSLEHRRPPLRVLHGPVNVGNQPWHLSRAERALQNESDLVVNYGTWLQYPADRTLAPYGAKKWGDMTAARSVRAVRALPLRRNPLLLRPHLHAMGRPRDELRRL